MEAITLAVSLVLGGSKDTAPEAAKPQTAGELTQGLMAFMSAAQNG